MCESQAIRLSSSGQIVTDLHRIATSYAVCMIKPDRPPFCSFMSIGVFWVRRAVRLGFAVFVDRLTLGGITRCESRNFGCLAAYFTLASVSCARSVAGSGPLFPRCAAR